MPRSDQPLVWVLGAPELAPSLRSHGLEVRTSSRRPRKRSGRELRRIRVVVLKGQGLTREELVEVVQQLVREVPLVERIVWLPGARAELALAAVRAGAAEVVVSRRSTRVVEAVRRSLEEQRLQPSLDSLQRARTRSQRFEGLSSRSPGMWDLFEHCVRVAPTSASVLILGETGTGKELLARALHRRSGRRGRFVAVNCGAVPEGLIDSELFGHEKGSFSGATGRKAGLFQHADGGTLLLDEIGDIPLAVQFRLLRALQEGRVRPVGGREEVEVDVRILAATSQPLEESVRSGAFREDLLYRLDVVRLQVAPLRERPEDIVFLFEHFLRALSRSYDLPRPALGTGFLEGLESHPWPGNVRELENMAERLLLQQREGQLGKRELRSLLRGSLPRGAARREEPPPPEPLPPAPSTRSEVLGALPLDLAGTLEGNLEPVVEVVTRRYLEGVLRETRGHVGAAAARAGLSRRTLQRRMGELGIDRTRFLP